MHLDVEFNSFLLYFDWSIIGAFRRQLQAMEAAFFYFIIFSLIYIQLDNESIMWNSLNLRPEFH